MKRRQTAFYLEALLLIAMMVAVILTLTRVFGVARVESARASHLTQAVLLAENAAEAVTASDSLEDVERLLSGSGNTQLAGNVLTVSYDDGYQTRITWSPEGSLVSSEITVCWNESELYSLDTTVFLGEVAR